MSQNITDTELAEKCPGLQKSEINVINDVRFYVEGVSLPIVAIFGIIFNLLSSVILGMYLQLVYRSDGPNRHWCIRREPG